MNTRWVKASAQISACGNYRYSLDRIWNESLPQACFVMLNPSIADANRDDPTLRRCIGFAQAWGYGGLRILNLFAGRATEPSQLFTSFEDPIGPGNDAALQAASHYREVIVAWGANGSRLGRDVQVLTQLGDLGIRPRCLGITKHGNPRHPLYVRGDARRVRFRWDGGGGVSFGRSAG